MRLQVKTDLKHVFYVVEWASSSRFLPVPINGLDITTVLARTASLLLSLIHIWHTGTPVPFTATLDPGENGILNRFTQGRVVEEKEEEEEGTDLMQFGSRYLASIVCRWRPVIIIAKKQGHCQISGNSPVFDYLAATIVTND